MSYLGIIYLNYPLFFCVVFRLFQAAIAYSNNKIMDVSNRDNRSDRRWHFTPYVLTIHATDLVIAKPNNALSPAQFIKILMRNDRIDINNVLERLQIDKVVR
jgi:hypothetical protein